MFKDLKEINGSEIIDFLNKITNDDISIMSGSFVFVSQEISFNEYILEFNADFNNWGRAQTIKYNELHITKDEVQFCLEEPFDGDGTDEELETILTEWIKGHEFSTLTNKFDDLIYSVSFDIKGLNINDKDKIQKIIDDLIMAKTYMK